MKRIRSYECHRDYTELTAGGSNDADIATPTNEPET